MKKIINFFTLSIFFFLVLSINVLNAESKIKIELQIENEIITNIDFKKEQNYLLALNNSLKDLPKSQLKQISRDPSSAVELKDVESNKGVKIDD